MQRGGDKGATLSNVKERPQVPPGASNPVPTPVRPGRIANLAGFGRDTALEYADELLEVVASLEEAFPEKLAAAPADPDRRGVRLADLREDREIMRPGASRWLKGAPDPFESWFRAPRAFGGEASSDSKDDTFPEITSTERHGAPTPPPPPQAPSGAPFPSGQTGDATDLLARLRSGRLGAAQHMDAVLARAADEPFGALVELHNDEARRRADRLDRRLSNGEQPLPLHGLPIAIKANLCVEDHLATCASRSLANYEAPYTATVVRRLVDAGAIPIAMANMDEFAMGSSGEHSAHGATINPWSPVLDGELRALAPGGSSSGTAAAVSGDLAPLALGSDAGGSVRQPAAFCGVTGLRPTQGRLSRFGLIAFASSFDVIGPVARSARDLELLFGLVAGPDPRDPTWVPGPGECGTGESRLEASGPSDNGQVRRGAPGDRELPAQLGGLRIGVPRRLLDELGESLEPGVAASFGTCLAELQAAGAVLVDVELASAETALSAYHVISCSEAASNLARIDGVRFGRRVEAPERKGAGRASELVEMIRATRESGFGNEVTRRILIGTLALSRDGSRALYGRAREARAMVARDFAIAFGQAAEGVGQGASAVDLIAMPTSPSVAFGLGARTADPVAMYRADMLTVPASLAGLPAISLPGPLATTSIDGRELALPAGLQLVGHRGEDEKLLRVAALYQSQTGHHLVRAPRIGKPNGAGRTS